MNLSKLLGGVAFGGLLAAGVAYAAVGTSAFNAPKTATKAVTATWAMGCEHEEIAGVASNEALTLAYTRGAGLNANGTVEIGGTTMTLFSVTNPLNGVKGDQYAEFTVTPADNFTPSNISFEFVNKGWGDGRYALEVICGATTKTLLDFQTPVRDNAADVTVSARTVTAAVSDITATPENPLKVRVYFYTKKDQTKAREYAFGNMVISGSIEEVEVPEVPDPEVEPGEPVEVPADWKGEVAPGQFNAPVNGYPWTYTGTRWQACSNLEDGAHVAYVKGGTAYSVEFFCKQPGVYSASFKTCSQGTADITYKVTDLETGAVEASTVFPYNKEKEFTVVLPGKLTAGKKRLDVSFATDHQSYVGNFHSPEFTLVGYEYAGITGITVDGVEEQPIEGYDYNFVLPADYNEETVVLRVASRYSTINAGENAVNGKKVTVATPEPSEEAVVDINVFPYDGAYTPKNEYKVRLYRIGGVVVKNVQVNGYEVGTEEILAALNSDAAAATLSSKVYTAVPSVKVTFADGSSADAAVALEGTTAKATFKGVSGKDEKEFSFDIEGVHLYSAAEGEKVVKLVFDSTNNQADGSWSNGLYTLRNSNDGWGGTQFKFKSNVEHSWSVPSNIIVKQVKFCQLGDNYAAGTVEYVASEGATVYLPSDNDFSNNKARYDLVVNIENHQAGEPIMFKFKDGSQPVAWFEFLVEEKALTGEPQIQEFTWLPTDEPLRQNHCVIKMVFDREMASGYLKYGPGLSKTAKAEGGSTALYFSLWGLEWNTSNAFEIPAGALVDKFGNSNEYPTPAEIPVGSRADVAAIGELTVVSNIDEFKAAIASCMETNKTADAPRRVIYMLDGDYNLGSSKEAKAMLHLNKAFNVSIIGESRDGVVLRGSIEGISNPVFSTRYSTNIYMENFTIRNDLDWGCFDSQGNGNGKGVGVAHYGGNRDIMVNMCLQSNQDTQVTGELGYYYNCEIYGSVDFICGGGNHFYDHCTLITTRKGSVLTAPSTSPLLKWGYVFSNCTVKGINGYNLGRPWKDEPRCYFINTTMEATCSNNGWDKMGTLPTHFYEYGSKDKNGNLIDLSVRGNSPTSTNKYTPVLTAEQAAEFTVENVLGGTNSWYAPEEYEVLAAPAAAYDAAASAITWGADNRAAGYVVCRMGKFEAYVPGDQASYALEASRAGDDVYTVRAMSANGTLSDHSAPVSPSGTVGVEAVGADGTGNAVYYNLQGVRVSEDYQGVRVRVAREADGARSVSKNVKL